MGTDRITYMKRFLACLLLLIPLLALGQSGNRVLTLTGTNTTSDWSLQKEATWSISASATNTHINVPISTTIKTAYLLRVNSTGSSNELQFVFPGYITTNWFSQFQANPRDGITYYVFEQYGSNIDITADPDVYPTAPGQILRRVIGSTSFGSIDLSLTQAVGSSVLGLLNGGTGQTTANAALNALLPSQGGNSGKFLTTDGANSSWGVAGAGSTLVYAGGLITVSNTTTETAIFTNTIPANTLGTNKIVNLALYGEVLNNSGGVSNFTFRVYLGATEIYEDFISPGSGGSYSPVRVTASIAAKNSASAQHLSLLIQRSVTVGTSPATGLGRLNGVGVVNGPVSAQAAEDSTATLPISITVTPQHAVGSMVFNNYYGVLWVQ